MRSRTATAIAAAAVGMSIFTATPASAATLITPDHCTAQGGTYRSAKGVKSCSTVTTSYGFSGLFLSSRPEADPTNPGGTVSYTAAYRITIFYKTLTTQSQKANRRVTTNVTTVETSRVASSRSCVGYHEGPGATTYETYEGFLPCISRDLVPS